MRTVEKHITSCMYFKANKQFNEVGKVKSYDYIVISGNNEEIYNTKKEVNKRVKELTSQGKTGYFAKWDLINDEILEGSQVGF